MIRWFRFVFMRDCDWRVVCEPSLFYSGHWAQPELWGQTFEFPSFIKAWWFAHGYCARHPFGKAEIHFKARAALRKAGVE